MYKVERERETKKEKRCKSGDEGVVWREGKRQLEEGKRRKEGRRVGEWVFL